MLRVRLTLSEVRKARAYGSMVVQVSQPTFSRRELDILKMWKRLHELMLSTRSEQMVWDGARQVVAFDYPFKGGTRSIEIRLDPRTLKVDTRMLPQEGMTDWFQENWNESYAERRLFQAFQLIKGVQEWWLSDNEEIVLNRLDYSPES